MIRDHCSRIGFISKPHGVSGEVILRLDHINAEDIIEGEPLFVEFDGTLVPFFITGVRPAGDMAYISLEFIESSEDADKLRNRQVYLEDAHPEQEETGLNLLLFKDWQVEDKNTGFTGIIEEVISNSTNPLFYVSSAGKHYYIPVQEEFIRKINRKKKLVFMDLPEGLLDINE